MRSIVCGTLFTLIFAFGCGGTQNRPVAASDSVAAKAPPVGDQHSGAAPVAGSAHEEIGERTLNGEGAQRLFDLLASTDADRRPVSEPSEMIMDHLSCDAAWEVCTFETIDGNQLREIPRSASLEMRALLLEQGITPGKWMLQIYCRAPAHCELRGAFTSA